MMIKMDEVRGQQLLNLMGVDVYRLREKDINLPAHQCIKDVGLADRVQFEVDRGPLQSLSQVVTDCECCDLHQTRIQPLLGEGSLKAKVMFIGEAPDTDEDREARLLVNQAGLLFDSMLAALGWQRDQVYITNLLKCHPPGNRAANPLEFVQCESYLLEQIDLIKPQLLVAMGCIVAQNLLQTKDSISSLRKQVHNYSKNNTPLIVTYHPAYLLDNPLDKGKSWYDLLTIRAILADNHQAFS